MLKNLYKMPKWLFYVLSLTWGLPMTFIGAVITFVLFLTGHDVEKFGYCVHTKVGKSWGGVNLGLFFLTSTTSGKQTKCHEHGHGLQNCILGPFMPFVVCIPSAFRYWVYEIKSKVGRTFYSVIVGVTFILIQGLLVVSAVKFSIFWMFLVQLCLVVWSVAFSYWAIAVEVPKHNSQKIRIAYDQIWFEGNATHVGGNLLTYLQQKQSK